MQADGIYNPIAAATATLELFQATNVHLTGSTATRSLLEQAAATPLPDEQAADSKTSSAGRGGRPPARVADPAAVAHVAAETARARALTFTPEEDQRALACLLLNMTPEVRDNVDHATSAMGAWLAITAVYQDHSAARYQQVYVDFANAKQGSQEGIQAYATRVTQMSRDLSEHGGVHSMPDLVSQFLRGVHERYSFERNYFGMLHMRDLSITSMLPAFLMLESSAMESYAWHAHVVL